MRLHGRISLHLLGVVVVVGVVTSVLFALGTRGAFQREIAERTARHLATLVGERMDDPERLARRLQEIRADLDVDITVRDLDGSVIAAVGRQLRPLGAAEAADIVEGRIVAHPRPLWFAAGPVRAPGSGRVVAILEVSPHRRFADLARLGRTALAAGVVLLAVALATAPLARRIARPLERLTAAARRLGSGDLAARVPGPERGGGRWGRRGQADEIVELTGAFNDMAERVERLVAGQRELLANVSHEFRSPLTRIRMALALLPRDGSAETRVRAIEEDIEDLERLVEDVLTAARLEATGLPARLERVDTRRLLDQIAEQAAHDPVTAGMEVRVADGQAVTLDGDEALLRRALWNLVENAAKYGAPPITLAAIDTGDGVTLSVSDEGPGIARAERDRVVIPFYRGDRARTPGAAGEPARGFGLGLALVRRVAEAHGGALVIGPARTTAGRDHGCRVDLVLPRSGETA